MRVLFAVALLLAAINQPSIAAEPAGAGTGNSWYAVRLPAGTTCAWLNSTHDGAGGYQTRAVFTYDQDQTLINTRVFRAWSGELYVAASLGDHRLAVEPFADQTYNYSQIDVRVGCSGGSALPTARTYVVITTGQSGPWTFSVESPDGLGSSSTHGSEAWDYRLHDFSGGISAGTSIAEPVAGATIEGSVKVTAKNILVGTFADRLPSAVVSMQAETPRGLRECPCYFADVVGAEAWGSGDYVFRTTSAGAWIGGPYLLLADIEMPS